MRIDLSFQRLQFRFACQRLRFQFALSGIVRCFVREEHVVQRDREQVQKYAASKQQRILTRNLLLDSVERRDQRQPGGKCPRHGDP